MAGHDAGKRSVSMKKKVVGRDYGTVLILAAFMVAVPRWAGVFIASDTASIPAWVSDVLHYVNLFAGIGMGFIEVLGAAYLLDAWGKLNPKKRADAKHYDHRWKVLTVFVFGLFALMPFILTPYIVARMTGVNVADALGNTIIRYLWGAAVVMSPIFIIGGTAVAREGLVGVNTQPVTSGQGNKEEPTRQDTRQANGNNSGQFTDWRTLPLAEKHRVARMETFEIQDTYGVQERTARNWRKNARQLSGQFSENGHAKEVQP
jgi:hypothetical protein